jgi:DNA-binding MarR family transcriptional regulator
MYHAMQLDGPYTPQERALLVALGYFAPKRQNHCSPGREKLKAKTGLSDHFLTKTMRSLEDKGLVKVGRRKDTKERWRNTSNTYTLEFVPAARAGSVEEEGVDIWRI